MLFSDHGRSIQLEILGCGSIEDDAVPIDLLVPITDCSSIGERRRHMVKRFNDFMAQGRVSPNSFSEDRRGPRLAKLLQLFDGAAAGAKHRDLAVALFGSERVERDWNNIDNQLRDHIRRSLAYARRLVETDYVRLLR